MSDKLIQAAQISTDNNSWYQRLRTIQGLTDTSFLSGKKITKTTDPGITSGSGLTASSVNNFLTALRALQSNTFLGQADWSSKPSDVTAGSLANESLYNNVNTLLTSLENICSNYGTKTTYNYQEDPNTCYNCQNYGTYTEYADYHQCTDTGCKTAICVHTAYSTYSQSNSTYNETVNTNSTCSNNTTYDKSNSTNNKSNSTTTNNYSCKTTTNNYSCKTTTNNVGNSTYAQDQSNSTFNNNGNTTYNNSGCTTDSKADEMCKTYGHNLTYSTYKVGGSGSYATYTNDSVNTTIRHSQICTTYTKGENSTNNYSGYVTLSDNKSNSTNNNTGMNSTYNDSFGNSTYNDTVQNVTYGETQTYANAYDYGKVVTYTTYTDSCKTYTGNSTYSKTNGGNSTYNQSYGNCNHWNNQDYCIQYSYKTHLTHLVLQTSMEIILLS